LHIIPALMKSAPLCSPFSTQSLQTAIWWWLIDK
jgi:hypothetical protein